ncbi:hypothetical protein AB0B25_16345 [Nocardia sp. NPDC049190]|uniref:hypothetical protein n=1 Tax=Nocardia sp. NPDC049190 TaxID=3155650 RepID=UPI0033C9FE6A
MSFEVLGRAVVILAVMAFSSLLFAGVANAATTSTIDSATAVSGDSVIVSITYSCDASSDVRRLTAAIDDRTSGAVGAGYVVPICNSQSHVVSVLVRPSGGAFAQGHTAKIVVDMVDGLGDSIGGVGSRGTLTQGVGSVFRSR